MTVNWAGAGTNLPAAWDHLDAKGKLSWTQGRVSNSSYLAEISQITGIPGFRDLIVMDSGGPFQIHQGILSSDGLRVWGPDASIQAAGTIAGSGKVDAEVALGIGPNANRELFSTGLVLPYVKGKNGWRFIPLHLSGPIEDPNMSIAPSTVLRSALTMIPDVSIGAVSRGAHATRAVGKAVVDGGRAVVDGTVGSLFRGLKRALGKSSEPPDGQAPAP